MAERKRVGKLEINQDLPFQRREWKVQRLGWGVMLLLALAGLFGVFGRGPLSHAVARSTGNELILAYERAVRHGAPTQLVVRLPHSSGEVAVWLEQGFLEGLELQRIVPQPLRTTSGSGRIIFFFQVQPSAELLFTIEPDRIGLRRASIGIISGPSLQFRQFVFP